MMKSLTVKCMLWCLVAVFLTGCATQPLPSDPGDSSQNPVKDPVSLQSLFKKQIGTLWYGIYLEDVKIGWARVRRDVDPAFSSSPNAFRIHKHYDIRLLINGYRHHLAYRYGLWFDAKPPYALDRFELFERINDLSVKKSMLRKGDVYQRTVMEDGKRVKLQDRQISYTLKDELALETWIREQPKVGDTIYLHFIDSDSLLRDSGVAKVIGMEIQPANGHRTKTYEITQSVMLQEKETSVYSDDLTLLVHKLSAGFELRKETRDSAQTGIGDVDLYVKFMLPIDQPLGGSDAVQRVKLAVGERTGALLTDATGQRVEKDSSGSGFVVTLETKEDFRESVVADDQRLYLKIPPAMRINGASLLKSAQKAVAGTETPEEKIERLLKFVDEAVEDSNEVLSPGLKYLLDQPKGDCSEHASLFEALARSMGIPCRQVSGLVYMGDWAQSFGLHAWNEVMLDGYWKPVDPIAQQFELPPLYIRFPLDSDQSDQLIRSIQKMNIKVMEVTHFESD